MGAIVTLQDWTTVQGTSTIEVSYQSPDEQLDASAWSDIVLYVEVSEISNALLVVQTAPASDDSLWKTLVDASANEAQWTSSASPPDPFIARWADADVPLCTLVRWAAARESAGSWTLTFRIRAMLKTS